jgi:hypothetical protein
VRTIVIAANLPNPGQLVDVRRRRYVVLEVLKSGLPPELSHSGLEQAQHLVTLSSVEDDGHGEELQVVWELEPGDHAYETMALPAPVGFDNPRRLDASSDFAQTVLSVAQQVLPARASKFAPGIFTQPQLLACLLIKQ